MRRDLARLLLGLLAVGQPLSGRSVTWSSDDDAVATVDAGAVRGMAPGKTIVRASSEGASVSATVTVEAGPAIVASPASVDFSGHIVVEINTRRCDSAEERREDLAESLAFAREHFSVRAHG